MFKTRLQRELSVVTDPLLREVIESEYLALRGLNSDPPLLNIVAMTIMVVCCSYVVWMDFRSNPWIVIVLVYAVFLALHDPLRRYFPRNASLRILRSTMRRHGVRICVACGYDLRSIDAQACPECGADTTFELAASR